ncbi:CRN1 (YLR429W) [Zygosaccharomyces parabailii]|nr:CRN1 (YLR429W) [Zygosaccharomyces parabailii]CDH10883.1 probable Coronin-like protein [Zygosaccharomyces bailii ISA1307]
MSGKFVRASKYRHVFGQPPKKELWYDNVKVTLNAWDSNLLKTNGKFISVNWNTSAGGSFGVIPVVEHGKAPEVVPLFRGHTAQVLDTDFDPFDDNRIASSSDDARIGIFEIPEDYSFYHNEVDEEGEAKDVHAVKMLSGHGRKVGHIIFHPVAKDVLASSSLDRTVKIWNVETGEDLITLPHPEMVTSMSFSYDGNYLATVARDKKLRVWNVRAQKLLGECQAHEGAKSQRVIWLGNSDRLATSGFSRLSERQVGIWDAFHLENGHIGSFYTVDQAPGILMPFYDDGNKILFLVGKGDGNIRYYEFQDDHLYLLSEYLSTDPQRGFAVAPRRSLNLKDNEIMKCFKTVVDTRIEPISFYVPRKSEEFQHDIYPDAPSDRPALTAEEWFSGKLAEGPLLVNLKALYEGSPIELHASKKAEQRKEQSKKEQPKKEEPRKEKSIERKVQDEMSKNEEIKEENNTANVPEGLGSQTSSLSQDRTVDKLLEKSSALDALNNAEDPSKDTSDWDGEDEEPIKKDLQGSNSPLTSEFEKNPSEERLNGVTKDAPSTVSTNNDPTETEPDVNTALPTDGSFESKHHTSEPSSMRESAEKSVSSEEPKVENAVRGVASELPGTGTGLKSMGLKQSAEKLSLLVYNLEGVVEKLTKANIEKNERLDQLETKIEALLSQQKS